MTRWGVMNPREVKGGGTSVQGVNDDADLIDIILELWPELARGRPHEERRQLARAMIREVLRSATKPNWLLTSSGDICTLPSPNPSSEESAVHDI